ncbi:YadA-like family protein [Fusobacterium necrophorum]|uniref:YadA-like family protein n=1 Tax=Fusobacterium necrophorum TaxID=859 RepID=UPI003F9F5FFB
MKNKKYLLFCLCLLAFSQSAFGAVNDDRVSPTGTEGNHIYVTEHDHLDEKPATLQKLREQNSLTIENVGNEVKGRWNVAIGMKNVTDDVFSAAFGYRNSATKWSSSAFGQWNEAIGEFSSAFGYWNIASGKYNSSAFGMGNEATASQASAFGYWNFATERYASAFGSRNEAKGTKSTAIGFENEAHSNATSVGYKNLVWGGNNAFGNSNIVKGITSTAIGSGNKIEGPNNSYDLNHGEYNFILGSNNVIAAHTNNNFILGNRVTIGEGIHRAVVLGSDSTAVNNAVSVGSATERRRIANVADGTQDTDAATVGQVKNLISQNSGTVLSPENSPEPPSPVLGPNSSNVVFQSGTGENSVIAGKNNKAEEWYSSAFGHDNEATESYSSAFGFKNQARGDYSSAFGSDNKATKQNSSAFGYGNRANGTYSSAFGRSNIAEEVDTAAFGFENKAIGKRSAAFGVRNEASGIDSFAFGRGNNASGTDSFAFGYVNRANGPNTSAFGINNTVDGKAASAFGYNNSVKGNNSSAFGYETLVSGEGSGVFGRGEYNYSGGHRYKIEGNNSWAIGSYNSIAAGADNNHILGNNIAIGAGITGSIVLGDKSTVEHSDTLSIGSATNKRRIVHVAEGTADTDAATVGQVKNLLASSSGSGGTVDAYTKAETDSKFATKTDVEGSLQNKVDKDASNLSESDVNAWKAKLGVGTGSGTPIDAYTKAESDNKFATVDSLNNKLDKEVYNKEKANFATKTELNTKADKNNVYTKTETDDKYLDKTTYNADKANFATKTELDSKVNKDGSNLSENDITIWKEKLAVATVNSIANTASGNQSTGLGHGNVISGNYSTAVGYKNKVSGNNSGAFGDPNIVTGNRSYAFGNDNTIAGDDNFVLGSNVQIKEGITNSVALGNNSTVSGSNEVSVGSSANKRKITNVADGEVSETSSDAVTGKQLYNAMKNTSGVENLRNEVNEKFADVKSKINHVGSLSAALSALHPMQYDPKAPNQIMAAVGHYKDKQAVAVGLNHYFSPNFMVNAGVALGNESKVNTMANLGFTWKIGKGSEEMPQENFSTELQRLTAENRELNERIRRLEEAIKK